MSKRKLRRFDTADRRSNMVCAARGRLKGFRVRDLRRLDCIR